METLSFIEEPSELTLAKQGPEPGMCLVATVLCWELAMCKCCVLWGHLLDKPLFKVMKGHSAQKGAPFDSPLLSKVTFVGAFLTS